MAIETREAGVWIDGTKLQDLGIEVLLSSEEPILSAPSNRTVVIPGRNGARYFGGNLTPIPFTFNCVFNRSEDYSDLKSRIQRFKRLFIDRSGLPKEVEMILEDQSDRAFRVVIDGQTDIERVALLGMFSLPLTCFDAYATSLLSNADVKWGSEVIKFTNDVYTYGHTGGGASDNIVVGNSKDVYVSVVGDDVRPTLVVDGRGQNVSIAWDGYELILGTVNERVIVDLGNYTVTRNGVLDLKAIGGDWLKMFLKNGNTLIEIRGSSMDLTFEVLFNDIFH